MAVSHRLARAALALGIVLASGAFAQEYPSRDIHAICNFPAGTGADIYVRYFSDQLSKLAGKPVIVDNRAGALGTIGTEAAARAKPDGYTLYIAPGSSSHAASAALFKKLPFDPVKDFTSVTTLAKLSFVFVVDPKSPIKTIADLTAHLKAKGKGSYGTPAPTGVVSAELYKKFAGVQATKVQYKDTQMPMNDMLAGNLDFMLGDASWAVEPAKSGKIRVLAVSGDRASALPDVPTMEEAGVKGFGKVMAWWAVYVPAKTPQPVVKKLEGWFNQIVATGETRKFLNNLGADPFPGNSKSATELLAADLKAWKEYVKLAGIPPQ